MKVLLIFQLFPEEIKYFLFDCTEEESKMLVKANNHIIGEEMPEDIQDIVYNVHDAISESINYINSDSQWAGKWTDKEIQLPCTPNDKIDLIITTGIYV